MKNALLCKTIEIGKYCVIFFFQNCITNGLTVVRGLS